MIRLLLAGLFAYTAYRVAVRIIDEETSRRWTCRATRGASCGASQRRWGSSRSDSSADLPLVGKMSCIANKAETMLDGR